MQAEQFLYPSADISRGRCFSRGYGMLIWLHLLLLSDDALWMSFLHLQHVTSERRRTWSFFTLFQVLLAELNKCNCSVAHTHPDAPELRQGRSKDVIASTYLAGKRLASNGRLIHLGLPTRHVPINRNGFAWSDNHRLTRLNFYDGNHLLSTIAFSSR